MRSGCDTPGFEVALYDSGKFGMGHPMERSMDRLKSSAITATPASAISLLYFTSLANAQPNYRHSGDMHGWGDGWHGMFLGPLMMLLFLAIATAVIVLIVRWLWGAGKGTHQNGAPAQKSALDILRDRFARGEIDAQEFEERRKILEQ
jgi:putative membrane protein